LRVALIGQAAFGEAVLHRLRADGVEIAGVSAPAGTGTRPDALWLAAAAAGFAPIATHALKDPQGLAAWRALRADLCVMAFVTEILPEEVFTAPRLGAIQYHPSLLPLHRGSSAMNWPIINGETETGITVFWPDSGIDTGPVLLQRTHRIRPDDTMGSLYFDHLFPMGVEALAEAVRLVAGGAAPSVPQNHAVATYEPPCRDEHAEIRWHEPADRVYALVRGCNPQPGAWTRFEGTQVRFFDCQLTGREEAGMPGRVLRVDEAGFDVRLNGGVLRVRRVQPAGGKKVGAGEWAAAAGLSTGARFR